MFLKSKIIAKIMLLASSFVFLSEAGICGYCRLYNSNNKVTIDIVYDKHIPYNSPQKKINGWEDCFHPADREFYNIIAGLDKDSNIDIDLYWEGFGGCEKRDPRPNAPFIIQAGVKLNNVLNNKVAFHYSDTQRAPFSQALQSFLDCALGGINSEIQQYTTEPFFKEGHNPITFIRSMVDQGFDKNLKNKKVNFLNDLKEVIFKNISVNHAESIKKNYGIEIYNQLKSYYKENRTYWRKYYHKNFYPLENLSVKDFICKGGIEAFTNLPYNSDVCRDHVPWNRLPHKIFESYQEIFDLETVFSILSSQKKRIIVYAGAAHCYSIASFLKSIGFTKKCCQKKDLNFLKPEDLNFLKSV